MSILHLFLFVLLLAPSSEAVKFAAVSGSSDFFLPVEQGWKDNCRFLGVDCVYVIPDFSNLGNGTTSADVCEELLLQLIQEGIDGLALGNTGCDGGRVAPIVTQLENEGIPVVLFDRDFVQANRTAYIGTDNVMMGRTMASLLKQLRPEGGTFTIVGTVEDRTNGFREEITRDNDREDRAQWHEIEDETITSDLPGGPDRYADIMDQFAEQHSPTAFIIMRQTPMRYANWTELIDRHRDKGITYIGTDGSDYQLSYLHRKYVDGLIGQLPYEFGSISVQTLYDVVVEKKEVDSIVATNLVAYNLIPLILPDLAVDQNLLHNLKYIGWICFGLIALTVIACTMWTFMNRDSIVVRASQPVFLLMTAFGVLLMGSALIPLSYDDNGNALAMSEFKRIGICMSVPWLTFTGFTITFSALFSKTWRINKLVNMSTHFIRAKVETKDVIGPFLGLITCNWVVLLCWTFIDPLKYERDFLPGTDFWNRDIASAGSCQSENPTIYLVLLGLLNLLVLAIACFQAFKARNIQTEFSEATYIGLAMFTLAQAFLSGIPIAVVVRDIPAVYYLVLTFLLFLLCMAVILFIFLPKISLQKKYKQLTPQEQNRTMASKLRKSMDVRREQANSGSISGLQEGSQEVAGNGESGTNSSSTARQKKNAEEDSEFLRAKLQLEMSESSANP